MLSLSRKLLGLEHLRVDCTAVASDGIDAGVLIENAVRQWYLGLLDSGSPEEVAQRPVEFTASRAPGGEGVYIRTAAGCRRVMMVRLAGWHHGVAPLKASQCEEVVRRQRNPYSGASAEHPVAVSLPDGNILAWPEPGEYGTPEVSGTVDDGPESYTFDERALSSLGNALNNIRIPDYGSF